MKNTYSTEIIEARNRTQRLGLACPPIPGTCERLLTEKNLKQLPHAILKAVGQLEYKDLVAQCLALHMRLKVPLEDFFGVPILYTIGYVHTPPTYLFYHDEEQLKQLLIHGMQSLQLQLHAWLTLPSNEIVDFSLPTSLAQINGWTEVDYGIITGHADELEDGVRYHPMLLGDDFLRKIGALVEFKWL